jgi:predicted acyltransferase
MSTVKPNKPPQRDPEKREPEKRERPAPTKPTSSAIAPAARLLSLDAYRGFIMLAMASHGFGLSKVVTNLQKAGTEVGPVLGFFATQLSHVAWRGYTFWDLIQPSFMFMVGVAMPFSYGKRESKGDSFWRMFAHAVLRSIVLVLLGLLLASNKADQTEFKFTNVLAQIGLGYTFLFLLWNCKWWIQALVAAAILGLYGWAFYQHPLPVMGDWPAYGVTQKDIDDGAMLEGERAPWSKNINFAAEVDRTFLNWFPRPKPYIGDNGGYQTLNFVPSLATMILGLLAGQLLRTERSNLWKLGWIVGLGVALMAGGVALDMTVLPSVKRIWTPSWTLISGAWTLWFLAAFYWVIDVRGWRRWSMPLVVVGCNSIAAYLMAQLMDDWLRKLLHTHIGKTWFDGTYGPILEHSAILAVMWLLCWYLYRQKAFLRI